MVDKGSNDILVNLVAQMRAVFKDGDWDKTMSLFEQMADGKGDRPLRLEATCLAARALIATNQRRRARALLKPLADAVYRKPVHYEFLARAFLDLKQFGSAAWACERAEALKVAEETSDRAGVSDLNGRAFATAAD